MGETGGKMERAAFARANWNIREDNYYLNLVKPAMFPGKLITTLFERRKKAGRNDGKNRNYWPSACEETR
ncbi:hypothetical protein WN51_03999 [Melipona quadrifasciata]|uniref:Uncharacterized protein n=1 Tax=Melipona quadrifasciata TaxID=166423 RepID=A0A0M8ZS47_9HYME|nr:hypothetical protein WN51_03999 [Melipona quadrifasciata]